MDKREQLFGSDVGSEKAFENVGMDEKYKTPEEVREAIVKLQEVKPTSDSDREFIEEKIRELENHLKFLETQK